MWSDYLHLMKMEMTLIVILFILLFLKLGKKEWDAGKMLHFINILLVINLIFGFFYNTEGSLFGNMFRTSHLLALEKNILNLGTLIVSLQSFHWLKDHKHIPEFYMLLLSTLLGMFFMISSNNLLMFYLGLELSTIPLAALANFDLEKKISSEAAMKFILSSAFSSGLLLFGISMIYGTTGTLNYHELSQQLTGSPLQILSFVMFAAGFGFKFSAIPFHLWTADVYESSPVAVASYLSVISKGAILFVFVSVLYQVFENMTTVWYNLLFLLSVFTMTIGNLFALRQQNMKRFLAFSSIAQVGFILIGITGQSSEGSAAVIYFILIYVFSNLGAFGVVSLVSAATGRETVNDYKGFYKNNKTLTWVLAISLFSLAGIPPTAGFFGKFFLLLAGAGTTHTTGGHANYILITIAVLNLIISLYYYLRIIRAMFMDNNDNPIEKVKATLSPNISFVICVVGIIVTGFASGAYDYIYSLVK